MQVVDPTEACYGDQQAQTDIKHIASAFPEEWRSSKDRMKQVQQRHYWRLRNQLNSDSRVAVLCFGHGAGVKQLSQMLPSVTGEPKKQGRAPYCSVTSMVMNGIKGQLELDMNAEHISVE